MIVFLYKQDKTMDLNQRTVLLDSEIGFPEGPRWRQDRLWFSDMFNKRVMNVDLDGNAKVVVEGDDWLSGLGWLPDGRLLVVAMNERRLYRMEDDGLVEAANLQPYTKFITNDMVVDSKGLAYIGEMGFDYHGGAPFRPASLVAVDADGACKVVDDDMAGPNGSVISSDGRTLVVAESLADRLTAFDIMDDGSLENKRVWAERDGLTPDGICMDVEEGIWVASPMAKEVLRIVEGGKVTHRFNTDPIPVACMLGGPEYNLLFICIGQVPEEIVPDKSLIGARAKIEYVAVDIPGFADFQK